MTFNITQIANQALKRNNILWVLGVLAFPFYLFPKGGVQISSVLLILAALQSMRWSPTKVINPGNREIAKLSFPLLLLVSYVIVVQLTWSAILNTSSMLIFIFYYVFNLFIFVGVARRCAASPKFGVLLVYITLTSVLLQTSLSLLGLGNMEGTRSVIFFQNPNQLGYFSLLSAGILTVGVRKRFLSSMWFITGLLCCLWLGQLSLSKAALVTITVLMVYGGLHSVKSVIWGVIAISAVLALGNLDKRVDLVETRFSTVGEQRDDSLPGRGYDRIWLHPEMNLLGGGEGAGWRWDSFIRPTEIHSSWATILFSYGIPGTIAALVFLYRLAFKLGLASLVPMLAIFLYGLTHMGLRFVPMWILFGLIAGLAAHERGATQRKASVQSAAPQTQYPVRLYQ